jgi:hypothetical protein
MRDVPLQAVPRVALRLGTFRSRPASRDANNDGQCRVSDEPWVFAGAHDDLPNAVASIDQLG